MKTNFYFHLLFLIGLNALISCRQHSSQEKGVTSVISGTIKQPHSPVVYLFDSYRYTTEGENYGLIDSAIIDSEGNFSLNVNLEKASFHKVRLGRDLLLGGDYYEIFLEPGDTLNVKWDAGNGINDTYQVSGGNQALYAQYTIDERNFFELDSFNQAKVKSIITLDPINAGQMNNSLKVDLTLFKKGNLSGKYVHGEFERYIAKRNDYLHASRALRYLFDSPLRRLTNTRIIYTNLSHFYFTDHTNISDDYLIFMKPFRDYGFYMKWLGVHYQLSVDPDSVFEKLALKSYVDLVAKEDQGQILACNLWHARAIYPLVWSQATFFDQLTHLQNVLSYDSTESVWKQSAIEFNSKLMLLKPGSTVKRFTAEDLRGNIWSTDSLNGNTLLYIWNQTIPDADILEKSTPENIKILHVYLANSQPDIAQWRIAMINSGKMSENIQHLALYGDEALALKSYFVMKESVQAYLLLNNQIARPFVKIVPRGNYMPLYRF